MGSLAVVGIESNQSAEFKIIEESDQNMSSIFSMDKNGSIYTSSSLDYETIPLYLLRVQIQVQDPCLAKKL